MAPPCSPASSPPRPDRGRATRRAPQHGALRQGSCRSATPAGQLLSCRPRSRLAHRITRPPPTRATAASSSGPELAPVNGSASPSVVLVAPRTSSGAVVAVVVVVFWGGDVDGATAVALLRGGACPASPSGVASALLALGAAAVTVRVPVVSASRSKWSLKR